jgi:hypothetical protein
MSDELNITVLSGEEDLQMVDRVWVAKNFPKENAEHFDRIFKKIEETQNKQTEFVEKLGPVHIESLPIEAFRRIQTKDEKRRKKNQYMVKRNQDPERKRKRQEEAQKPENIAKRQQLNRDPSCQFKKSFSGRHRRCTARLIQREHPDIYKHASERAAIHVREKMELEKTEKERLDTEIGRLEEELYSHQ